MAPAVHVDPAPMGETAAQWWERVRVEHGPPPASLRDLYRGIRGRAAARAAAGAAPAPAAGSGGAR